MPRYKIYYEGFKVVEADTAEEAELNEDDYIYEECEITRVEEIDPEDILMDI